MKRPGHVTWLAVGVVILAGVHLAGFKAALALPDLPFSVPRSYFLLRNALWGSAELIAAAGAWGRQRWAPALLRWGAVALAGWYWLDWLILAKSDYSRLTAPLNAGFSILALLAIFWITGQPAVRRYFEERAHE